MGIDSNIKQLWEMYTETQEQILRSHAVHLTEKVGIKLLFQILKAESMRQQCLSIPGIAKRQNRISAATPHAEVISEPLDKEAWI